MKPHILLLLAVMAGLWLACSSVQLKPGGRLIRAKCTACHLQPERGRFDRMKWTEVLDEHQERFPLTAKEKKELLDWLAPI